MKEIFVYNIGSDKTAQSDQNLCCPIVDALSPWLTIDAQPDLSLHWVNVWATTWQNQQNQQNECAPSEDSVWSVFAVRSMGSYI